MQTEGANRAKKRQLVKNTLYTIGGALVLNGILQLLIYPRLNAELGAEQNGMVLYIMAFVNILGPSVGQAMNNSRLVVRRELPVTNGDYNLSIGIFSAVGILVSLLLAGEALNGVLSFGLAAAVMLLTIYRFYGDVEYRLSLDYRKYFIYYTFCGVGYALGYLFYRLSGQWMLIFVTGEAAALLYVWLTGSIFRPFADRSKYFPVVVRRGLLLVISYLVTNVTLNIDRLYLKSALGGTAVTQYYVVSLIGKTLVLFIAPINTIIISYLTKENRRISRKQFFLFSGAGMVVSAVFFLLCQIGTPLFIRLFYPDLSDSTAGLVTVVNLTQILAMLSAYLFIVVLTFTDEKWQLILQVVHLIVLLGLIVSMTPGAGIRGFAAAMLIANALRIGAVMLLGTVCSGRKYAGKEKTRNR